MLIQIVHALKERKDLAGWTVRHIITRGAQVYAVPQQVEARRSVTGERYRIDVLRQTSGPDGAAAMGSGDATILPGGEISAAIEKAMLVASLVSNPIYTLPGPASIPDVQLIDTELQSDPSNVTVDVMERIRTAAS